LLAEAQCQPILLVLEDLHWADEVSVDLLASLLDGVGQAPMLIVALSRPASEGPLAGLREQARQRLGDRQISLPLEPLALDESQQLLGELLMVPRLPEGLRDQILERAAGVPFYLEEILRMLIDAGMLGRESGTGQWRVPAGADVDAGALALSVPDTLQGLILTRFDRLNAVERQALQVAAVIGRQFGQPMLLAVLARLRGPSAPDSASVTEALAQLARREFIAPLAPAAEQEYEFRHSLVSDAIYSTLLRQDRHELHGLVGQTIEELYAGRLDEHIEELARHYGSSPRQDRALHYHILAGQKAARGNAVQQARGHFEQAQNLLTQVPHTVTQALDTFTGLGQVLLFVGEYEAAREQFRAGLTAMGAARLPVRRSELERLLSRIAERQGNHEEALQRLAAAETALDQVTPPQPVEKAQILHDIGWIHFRRGDMEQAREYLNAALRLVEDDTAYDVIASIYNRLGGLAYSQGDWTASASYVRKSIALREASGDGVSLANSFNNLGVLELEMGQYDSALENLTRSHELKRRQGQADGIAVALNNLGLLRVRRGELPEAQAALTEAREIARQIGYSSLLASVLMHVGELHLAAREWAEARAVLNEGARLFEDLGVPDQLLEMRRLLGEVALELGDVNEAGQCHAQASALYAALGSKAARLSTLQRGEYERFRGRLALYRGQWAAAQQLLRTSAEIHQTLGNRFYQGRITFDLGLLAERQGEPQRAQLQYREASLLFRSVGARLDTARADAALARRGK
jgi:tetratricopeptide (TPR) repeat protein